MGGCNLILVGLGGDADLNGRAAAQAAGDPNGAAHRLNEAARRVEPHAAAVWSQSAAVVESWIFDPKAPSPKPRMV